MPPYVMSADDLGQLTAAMVQVIQLHDETGIASTLDRN